MRQVCKADLNEIIVKVIKARCDKTPYDADVHDLIYSVAFIDGVNYLGDEILNFIEGKEKEDGMS
jgi:hypothetical protein